MTKKILVTLFVLVIALSALASSAQFGERGFYLPLTKTIICHDAGQCLHEIGHASDHSLGWVSDGADFRFSLFQFTYTDHVLDVRDNHEWTGKILFYPCFFSPCLGEKNPFLWSFKNGWGGSRELYADMLLWSGGKAENMPPEFLEYFNWQLIANMLSRYVEVNDG